MFFSLKPRPFIQSSFDDMQAPRSHTCFFLFFLFFCLFGDVAFSEYFCTIPAFSLYGEYVVLRSFLANGVYLPREHELDF